MEIPRVRGNQYNRGLMAKDADVKIVSGPKQGSTPLDLANDPKTAGLLRKHGGKTSAELKAEGK